MHNEKRQIVFPSQILGDTKANRAGRGTFIENGKIISERVGILNKNSEYLNVIPLTGRYEPVIGDFIIGVVEEALSAGWLVDINAPSPAFLHTEEVPWDVEFGATEKYLNHGDSIMAKVFRIDEQKKMQITMKDRNLFKMNEGDIIEVEPSKVPRIIGKKGSMITLIKKYIRCRIFVGQNGRIWVDAEPENIERVKRVIDKIQSEAIKFGLTNRIEELLKNEVRNVQQ
jgi:exosome complex component RRP4